MATFTAQTTTEKKKRGYNKPADVSVSRPADRTLDVHMLRTTVDDLLNRLGARLIGRVSDIEPALEERQTVDPFTAALQKRVAQLGQIAAGLAVVDPECLPAQGAGYGSLVTVKDLVTGERDEYMLMVGSLVDINANQVSLASPIGQALLGKAAGDEITVTTPHKEARLLVTRVVTLMDLLADDENEATVA